jgi:hypothetical protein
MDYGDEMNDDEEMRYAKENYGDNSAIDEDEEEGEDEDEEENEEESEEQVNSQKVIPLAKEFSRRQNRG